MKTQDVVSCIVSIYNLNFKTFSRNIKEIVNCRESNKINMLKELYKRIIVPLYIPILMLIPYFLILSSKEKKNYSKLKLITFLFGVLIIILSEGIIKFVSIELTKSIFIFITPLIILLTLYLIFLFKLHFRNQ